MNISDILVGVNSSALNVPLNHTNWLLDYKINGTKSYVYKDKDILHELYKSPISANDDDIKTDAFKFIANNHEDFLGTWLSKNYEFRNLQSISQCKSISEILSNSELFDAVAKSEFIDSFLSLDKAIDFFTTVASLKTASRYNNVMSILESSDRFKSNVSKISEVLTVSGSPTSGAAATTVQNAYVISATLGVAIHQADATIWCTGYCNGVMHGETNTITIVNRTDGPSDTNYMSRLALTHKFVKSLTLGMDHPYYTKSNSNNVIVCIKLDTVV